MAVTIKQISEVSGVSRGTVDRVLNNRGRVNPETERLVRKVAEELGYKPNMAGKALAAIKKNFIIGVILCSEGNAFFDDVIKGMKEAEKEASQYGISVVVKTMKGYDADRQLELMKELQGRINILILQPINDAKISYQINALSQENIPVITLNNDIENSSRMCYVGSNYIKSGQTAAGCVGLLSGGKANLGIATGSIKILGHNQRVFGFNEIRKKRYKGLTITDIVETDDDDEQGYEQAMKMLKQHPQINALYIVAAGATGVCRAVQELNREEGMLIVACDSTPAIVRLMKDGTIKAAICQQPYKQGYDSIKAAVDYLIHGIRPLKEKLIDKNEIKILENLTEEE